MEPVSLPWWEALVATTIVIALLGATLWLLRKGLGRQSRGPGGMAVESSLSLGERRSLVVVSVEGRRLLLGVAPGQVRLVSELGAVPPTDPTSHAGVR
jgi:flagellar protein FliO/FliZ